MVELENERRIFVIYIDYIYGELLDFFQEYYLGMTSDELKDIIMKNREFLFNIQKNIFKLYQWLFDKDCKSFNDIFVSVYGENSDEVFVLNKYISIDLKYELNSPFLFNLAVKRCIYHPRMLKILKEE